MTKEKHYCDNINCNHNNTKGLCCLFNSDNCKYRQLQKENAELTDQLTEAKKILKKYLSIGVGGKITQNYLDVTKEAEQFLSEVEK